MRVRVEGNYDDARDLLRNYLEDKGVGYTVSPVLPDYTVYLDRDESGTDAIVIDSIDSPLERRVLNFISELTQERIAVQRQGGVQSERAIRVFIGKTEFVQPVCQGVMRALLKIDGREKELPWYKRMGLTALVVGLASMASAQSTSPTGAFQGVLIHNEGVLQCRALTIDFIGAGVDAACAGSIGQITVAGGGAGTPASTVEDETTFSIVPAVGVSDDYARADHTHGTPTIVDADVPNNITIDQATLALTGDSATAFFSSGTIEGARLPDPQAAVNGGVEAETCSGTDKISAINTDGTVTCSADETGGGGGAPTDAKYIVQQADATLTQEQALGALATGILKSTTTTGVLSIAVAGDFPTLNQNTTGTAAAFTANPSDCATATHFAVGVTADGTATCEAIGAGDVPTLNQNTTGTAAALTANGSNCGAGNYARGVDAAGNAEDCTAAGGGSVTTLTSTTLQSDAVIATYTAITGLSFTPAASTNYYIDCFIIYTSTAATTGINFAWDVPAAVTSIHMSGFTTTVATGANEGFIQRADNVGTATSASIITTEQVAVLRARLRNGANATTASLGFTPETANSVSVLAGSTCQYWTY